MKSKIFLLLIICIVSTQQTTSSNIIQCDPICLTCKGTGPSECLTCIYGRFFYQGTCTRKCPENMFGTRLSRLCAEKCENINEYGDPVERVCKPCHGSCRTCIGPLAKDCTSCDGIVYKQFSENQKLPAPCVCRPGYYYDSETELCESKFLLFFFFSHLYILTI